MHVMDEQGNSVATIRQGCLIPSRTSVYHCTQGLADWAKIKAVKEAVSVPVFANGNILFQSDIEECLRATGADAVMSAEGQLYNAALFVSCPTSDMRLLHPPHADLALEYLSIVQSLRKRTPVSAIKGHLFKLMRPALSREKDLRDRLGRIQIPKHANFKDGALQPYVEVCEEMKGRMEVGFLTYYRTALRGSTEGCQGSRR